MKKIIPTLLVLFIFSGINAQKGTIKVKKVESKKIEKDCDFEFVYEKGLLNKKAVLKNIYILDHPEFTSIFTADSTLLITGIYRITELDFQQYLSKHCKINGYKIKHVQIMDPAGFYDNRGEAFNILMSFEKLQ